MVLGKNTVEGTKILGIVTEIEQIRLQKKELSEQESAILATARADGLSPEGIRYLVKVRAMKPHDRQEAEAIRDSYLHAIGMDEEPPMFRLMRTMAEDAATREQLIERFKAFAPAEGDIILRMGGEPVRLYRDKAGDVHVEPFVEKTPRRDVPGAPPAPKGRAEVPDVDDAGATALGRQYARDNRPVIDNPFPFGDTRRARFDEGWRSENGGDGMGPDEDD